jgi:hypothetical protein
MDKYFVLFRKVLFKRLKGYGQYRGDGRIEFYYDGIRICGSHVYSMGTRVGIGTAIFFGTLIFCCGVLTPLLIPYFLIMEYGILKSEDISIPFENIICFTAQPEKKRVGIQFLGMAHTSPVVLQTSQWSEIYNKLYERMPEREANAMMIPGYPLATALPRAIFVFFGLFITSDVMLFMYGYITDAMPSQEGVMLLSELLLFLGSLVVAVLYFTRSRASMPPVPSPASYWQNV